MSGHSKWANIKRRKGAQDQKRGQVFSKLARAIAIAVKEGGSASPEANAKLRTLIQQAKEANMPKENIQRAIEAGQKRAENLSQFVLEGYGPHGVAVLLTIASDNRQRSVQEIKNIFSRHGGRLAEPGAVAFQFERIGEVTTANLAEEQLLALMDFSGVKDWREERGNLIFSLVAEQLPAFLEFLQKKGIAVKASRLISRAKVPLELAASAQEQVGRFLEELDNHEDVQEISTNLKEQ